MLGTGRILSTPIGKFQIYKLPQLQQCYFSSGMKLTDEITCMVMDAAGFRKGTVNFLYDMKAFVKAGDKEGLTEAKIKQQASI